jgi:arabinan endo-1,5-alpha-L-arabinosidase
MRPAVFAAAALVLAGCAAVPEEALYRNPLLPQEFADPAILRVPDGWYYAYATQGARGGRTLNIQVARTRDLVHWEHRGDALPRKPAWGATKQWFWAPHVLYDAALQTYFMYYSAEPDDARGKCLAVAVSRHPEGPFVDRGAPLLCGTGIENIDPMAFDDPLSGKRLLYWGSGRLPLRVQELDASRTAFAAGSRPLDLIHPSPRPYRSLVEAPWIAYRHGWYYLFFSGDRCCVEDPSYAVLVARSRSPLGPFEERESPVLEASERWLAPGHCALVEDAGGTGWMLYHAIDRTGGSRARVLAMDPVRWSDEGWPFVDGPSSSARRAPRAGPRDLR